MEKKLLLIDSHVHIYNCFPIKSFFTNALENFKVQCLKSGFRNFIGILFLTETKDYNYFSRLKDNHFKRELDELDLKLIKNNEIDSLVYKNRDNNYLVLIAGKQIITLEKLEVLALGTVEKLEYGKNLKESIEYINFLGALPVLPWGVGKWIGTRGKIIKDYIENKRDRIFLGDNSGRPEFWLNPEQFKLVNTKDIIIIRGSDPLPIKSQEKKIGKFGFLINEEIDLDSPSNDLKKILSNLQKKPQNFGKLEGALNFFRHQFLLNFVKRN